MAARVLAGRYPRVMIRNKNLCWAPLRLRRVKIADLEPFIVMNPPEFDRELAAWNRVGGLLLYDRPFTIYENVGAHQAQLVSECPMSITALDSYLEGASEVGVVYRPPNWDEHRLYIEATQPPAAVCKRLWEAIEAARPDHAVADALGLSRDSHVLAEPDAQAALEMGAARVRAVRKAMLPKRAYRTCWRAVLRTPPPDATLANVYHFIEENCPEVHGVRLISGMTLMQHVRFWKMAMRALERCGAVGLKDVVYLYRLERVYPHWERLDARRRVAQGRLAQVIKLVERAAELKLPAVHSPQSRFLPRRAQPSSSPASP